MKYILASGSPRRKELLTNMGVEFEIRVSDSEETITEKEPAKIVESLSLGKAVDVAGKLGEIKEPTVLIAADTLVFLNDEILGKPVDKEDAVRMVMDLSGKTHKVITGVTLMCFGNGSKETVTFHEVTEVVFATLTREEAVNYVNTGEPLDKAGAYAIQGIGAKFVEGIRGDYSNVVGLPVPTLYKELRKRGWINV